MLKTVMYTLIISSSTYIKIFSVKNNMGKLELYKNTAALYTFFGDCELKFLFRGFHMMHFD
jgi:hypothetical protein